MEKVLLVIDMQEGLKPTNQDTADWEIVVNNIENEIEESKYDTVHYITREYGSHLPSDMQQVETEEENFCTSCMSVGTNNLHEIRRPGYVPTSYTFYQSLKGKEVYVTGTEYSGSVLATVMTLMSYGVHPYILRHCCYPLNAVHYEDIAAEAIITEYVGKSRLLHEEVKVA